MPVYVDRRDLSAAELRKRARTAGDSRASVRMLMIANLLDGMEREDAARAVGLGRQASYDWLHRYEEEGVSGLYDRPRSGRPRTVDEATAQALRARVVEGADIDRDGVVAFRGADAHRILAEEFGVEQSMSSSYRLLHRLELSWLAPRPCHRSSDAQEQAEFRKLQDYNLPESAAKKPPASESRCGFMTRRGSARRIS